jgi:hypothetical protein
MFDPYTAQRVVRNASHLSLVNKSQMKNEDPTYTYNQDPNTVSTHTPLRDCLIKMPCWGHSVKGLLAFKPVTSPSSRSSLINRHNHQQECEPQMGTFGKHASTKCLGLSASKRKSTGKLNSSSRTSRHSYIAQKVGKTILSRWSSRDHIDERAVPLNRSNAMVRPLNPSICMTAPSSEQKICATDLPPIIPRRGIDVTDLPPSIPIRIRSRSSRGQLSFRRNYYDDVMREQGQHNAVFGEIDIAKPHRRVHKERCLDRPPSYNRNTSVSALNTFANISIKSKPSFLDTRWGESYISM